MKRLVLFVVMLMAVIAMAQLLPSWGYPVQLGTQFFNTDSLALRDDAVTDTLPASGTLYSDVILFRGDREEGIFRVSFSLDTLTTATTASIYLRFYYGKHLNGYFGPWRKITGSLSESYYPTVYNLADSSWWGAAAGRQWKVVNNSANKGVVRIIEFPR